MHPRTSKETPPKRSTDPSRTHANSRDEKEDQADSGPDRDNPITQESKQPPRRPR
jgi:hypothetical protein